MFTDKRDPISLPVKVNPYIFQGVTGREQKDKRFFASFLSLTIPNSSLNPIETLLVQGNLFNHRQV